MRADYNSLKKTGNFRHRVSFFGKHILQVEWTYLVYNNHTCHNDEILVWKDAKANDVWLAHNRMEVIM